ncbi:MAG: DUF4105 domain-containing protein [Candidatus Cloacimonetes bacterium]|nr:DUF4105 domain-containing protein [Candidatus Cloacimonadota bacterium]
MIKFILLLMFSVSFIQANEVYNSMLQKLGVNFTNGQDPYIDQYKNTDELVRFPELIQQSGDYWLIDNYREMRWSKEVPKNGLKYKFYKNISPKWTSALIDVSKLKSVRLYILNFRIGFKSVSFPVGHVQLMYEFEDGGVVTPAGSVNNLVHSFEAYLDYAQDWNPITGIKDEYESVILLGSYKDSIAKALTRFDEIKTYQLQLSPSQKKELLANSLKLAVDKEQLSKKYYHTTRNSCATNQITLLNQILPQNKKIQEWSHIFGKRLFRTFGTILPNRVSKKLKRKSLIVKDSKQFHKDLEELYNSL